MKRFLAIAFFSLSSIAFGATLVPVQLLNPVGSTAGQTIVSTGASSAPAWGGVPVGGLAAIAANSVIANATNASAVPTAVTVAGCSGAAQALQWTNGTGFGCNSNVATAGANTNITSLSSPTITTPNIQGVTNGSAAAAGQVGQFVTATATSVALTNNTAANVTSISLTAGDWDVSGQVAFVTASGTTLVGYECGISTTSATMPANQYDWGALNYSSTGAVTEAISCPVQQINVSTTTTVFLVGLAAFTGSTTSASGRIRARRVH